jgi:hypothetical protein
VSNWSRQRGTRLRDGLATHRKNAQLLEELIAWLNHAENKLFNDNAEPIPDDVDIITQLMREHSVNIILTFYFKLKIVNMVYHLLS